MASTSVHLPEAVVERLDRLAVERGTSRNKLIVLACEELLERHRGAWPPGFFDTPLPVADQALLDEAGAELATAIAASRRVSSP